MLGSFRIYFKKMFPQVAVVLNVSMEDCWNVGAFGSTVRDFINRA